MKITITGASGFVGSNLSKYLEEKGNTIDKLSLRKPDFSLQKDAKAVIHLAGKAHDTANTSADDEYFEINTELTKKLFDDFLNSEIKDFLFFSSVKATADTLEGILDENHPSSPQTPYGRSKWEAEKYLLSKNLPSGKRLFIIRPCMIHGPGNKGNLNLLYKVVEKGIPWPLASFENKRSFLGIDNLNFLIEKMLNSKLPPGIYNFADDEPVSTNELVSIIGETIAKKAKLWKIPSNIVFNIAKFGDKVGFPLNSERLKKLTESYVVSNQKIKTALKIEELPLSAQDGLKKTIMSFKNAQH